jgi:hypothetical protein
MMSKNLRKTLVWIIFASAVPSVAYWQAQVAVAKDQKTAQLKLLLLIDPNRTREVESALGSTR